MPLYLSIAATALSCCQHFLNPRECKSSLGLGLPSRVHKDGRDESQDAFGAAGLRDILPQEGHAAAHLARRAHHVARVQLPLLGRPGEEPESAQRKLASGPMFGQFDDAE